MVENDQARPEPKAEGGTLGVKADVHGKLKVTVADTGLGGKAATAGTGVGRPTSASGLLPGERAW
jgi:hypothetical protein